MTIHQTPEVAEQDIVQVPAGTATFKSRHPETITPSNRPPALVDPPWMSAMKEYSPTWTS